MNCLERVDVLTVYMSLHTYLDAEDRFFGIFLMFFQENAVKTIQMSAFLSRGRSEQLRRDLRTGNGESALTEGLKLGKWGVSGGIL